MRPCSIIKNAITIESKIVKFQNIKSRKYNPNQEF